MKALTLAALAAVLAGTWACGSDSSPSSPSSPSSSTPPTPLTLTKPTADSPADGAQLDSKRPTLTVNNGTSNQTTAAKTYEFQISDNASFTATASFNAWFAVTVTATSVAEGTAGKTSYTPTQDLQPTTKYYWRARLVQGSTNSEWSDVRSFKTKLEGYSRPGELYDPLIFGETVGRVVGSVTWLPGRGVRLNDQGSYIKYVLPEIVTSGEYSMDVEGLQANAPGDKPKVFGMADDDGSASFDFVTNLWRVDVQYRGTAGVPPNCIQWRAMFGDDSHKIEPATEVRYQNVFLLNPSTTYHFKALWGNTGKGNGFRLLVLEGGRDGVVFYDQYAETSATYRPPHPTAYLGTPVGRSGSESATIPGTIYRNVWLSRNPRPASLGSALDQDR
jgi:hypothetical protein